MCMPVSAPIFDLIWFLICLVQKIYPFGVHKMQKRFRPCTESLFSKFAFIFSNGHKMPLVNNTTKNLHAQKHGHYVHM